MVYPGWLVIKQSESKRMADKTESKTIPMESLPLRWPKHAVWLGLVLTLVGALSYFLYFSRFPSLRDFPVLNLPIVLLGVLVAGVGCWRVFQQKRGTLGKGLAGLSFLFTLGLAGLFNFYIFAMSYQLPESSKSPASEATAPDFTLLDHKNQNVTLSDSHNEKVVLIFYRGFW